MTKELGTIKISETTGYRYIKTELKWEYEHRFLIEKYLGRRLKSEEIVHHIDGNKLNNELSNLYIFPNKQAHFAFELLIKLSIINRFILKSNII